MNHARRLAEGDWAGVESDEDEGKDGDEEEEEEMEVDAGRRLPKRYANQVRGDRGERRVGDRSLRYRGARP